MLREEERTRAKEREERGGEREREREREIDSDVLVVWACTPSYTNKNVKEQRGVS